MNNQDSNLDLDDKIVTNDDYQKGHIKMGDCPDINDHILNDFYAEMLEKKLDVKWNSKKDIMVSKKHFQEFLDLAKKHGKRSSTKDKDERYYFSFILD